MAFVVLSSMHSLAARQRTVDELVDAELRERCWHAIDRACAPLLQERESLAERAADVLEQVGLMTARRAGPFRRRRWSVNCGSLDETAAGKLGRARPPGVEVRRSPDGAVLIVGATRADVADLAMMRLPAPPDGIAALRDRATRLEAEMRSIERDLIEASEAIRAAPANR